MNETSHRPSGGNLRSNHALCNARHDRRQHMAEDRLSRLCPDLGLLQRLSRPVYAERTAVRAAHDPFGPCIAAPPPRSPAARRLSVAVDIYRGCSAQKPGGRQLFIGRVEQANTMIPSARPHRGCCRPNCAPRRSHRGNPPEDHRSGTTSPSPTTDFTCIFSVPLRRPALSVPPATLGNAPPRPRPVMNENYRLMAISDCQQRPRGLGVIARQEQISGHLQARSPPAPNTRSNSAAAATPYRSTAMPQTPRTGPDASYTDRR